MKKALSVIMCLCMVFCISSYADIAFASPEKLKDDVNPFYADCYEEITEGNRMLPYTLNGSSNTVDNKTVFKDCKSAAMFLRDCMVKRVSKVIFRISKNPKDNLVNVYNANVKDSYYPLHGAFSYEISNSSSDGDYLALSYAGTKDSYKLDNNNYYQYTYNILYRTTAAEEKTVDKYVNSAVNAIKAKNLSRIQQIKAVHDNICTLTEYDYDHYTNGYNRFSSVNSAYSAVSTKLTMCTGYSMLFYKMCRNLGIPVRIVQSKTHAWNIVKPVTGKYYYNVDVTWDDNTYPDVNAPFGCDYFLKNDADVITRQSHRGYLSYENEDHKRINEFANDYFNKTYPISPTSFYLNNGGKAECAYCNSIVDGATPTSLDHNYTVTVVKPKCHIDGKTVYKCTHCTETFSERIPALDHSFSSEEKYCLNGCGAMNPDYKKLTSVATKFKSITPKGNKVIVKWNKKSSVTGYQIQYSTNKKFKKKQTVRIKKAGTVSKKIKVKKNKKYYFRIRTYKVKGKRTAYSKWSKAKIVKT